MRLTLCLLVRLRRWSYFLSCLCCRSLGYISLWLGRGRRVLCWFLSLCLIDRLALRINRSLTWLSALSSCSFSLSLGFLSGRSFRLGLGSSLLFSCSSFLCKKGSVSKEV